MLKQNYILTFIFSKCRFMRQCLLVILLTPLLFSCKKSDDSKPVSTANFTVSGLRDVDFRTISSNTFTFPISIASNPGTVDTVFLYANDLPGGLYVDFSPINGVTPFTSNVKVSYYGTAAGTFTIHIRAVGRSGVRTYDLKVTQPEFKGWKLAGEYYHNTSVERDPGNATKNPTITVNAMGGSQLVFTFALGTALPTSSRTYTISSVPTTNDRMAITLFAPGHQWMSTGSGSATGAFTFDTAGKFTFNCDNVEMADSTKRDYLTCSFGE